MAKDFDEIAETSEEIAENVLHPSLDLPIEKKKFKTVNPATYNPRVTLKPGDEVYEQLKRSLTRWKLVQPLVFNKQTGNLVAGHQRLTVMKDMGYDEAEFVIVDIPLSEEKALNIALNKISGFWDMPKLQSVLDELHSINDELPHLAGFNDDELKKLLDSEDDTDLEEFEKFDENVETEYRCPKCGYKWSGNPE